jgi:hypothetical protein
MSAPSRAYAREGAADAAIAPGDDGRSPREPVAPLVGRFAVIGPGRHLRFGAGRLDLLLAGLAHAGIPSHARATSGEGFKGFFVGSVAYLRPYPVGSTLRHGKTAAGQAPGGFVAPRPVAAAGSAGNPAPALRSCPSRFGKGPVDGDGTAKKADRRAAGKGSDQGAMSNDKPCRFPGTSSLEATGGGPGHRTNP